MASRGSRIAEIAAVIEGAEDAPELAQEGDIRPFGGHDDDDALDAPPLPPDCPVTPLGMLDQRCWYLDVNGQIIGLDANTKHGKNGLIAMFGTKSGWLEKSFPQWSKPKKEFDKAEGKWIEIEPSYIVGFDQAKASRALIEECSRRGIFDPAGKVRGAGAHRGSNDALILHLGRNVMRHRLRLNGEPDDIEYFPVGLHGEHVYPAASAIPTPWPDAVGAQVGEALFALLSSWHWKRKLLDPRLVLGGIGASLLGGALKWRSNIWITGGRGTGKSTLNGDDGLLDQLFGQGQFRTAQTSAAGIRQSLRNSTVPVFLDELEASKHGEKTHEILELARVSSSGARGHRGGQDHQAVEFTLKSAFWASSILIPPMDPQDRSRWAICALRPIPAGAKPPNLKAARLPEMGRKILRRMVDGWHRWDETLEAYRDALGDMGHKARACDQFGTLLAAADLILYDALPDLETIQMTAQLCDIVTLREVADSAEEHELCLQHLTTSLVQARGGEDRSSIGSWIGEAVQDLCAPHDTDRKDSRAHRRLQEMGLKIVMRTEKGASVWEPKQPAYLAVANSHQALAGVFTGTHWIGGVWSQALARCEGAIEGVKVKFARASLTAVLVPLGEAMDLAEVPERARWDGAQEGAEA